MIDIHSHVLPGVDDGAKNLETSLNILKGLEKQGITDVVCTPHFVAETSYNSDKKFNEMRLKALKTAARAASINIRLTLGNEIYVDSSVSERLKTGEITGLAGSRYLLIELPMSGEFPQYEDIFKDLRQKGYQVILAHPERYRSTQKTPEILENLAGQGILFQCNLGSFIGQYGKNAKKLVKKLAKNHQIFALGTDIHHERDYTEIQKAIKKLQKYYKKAELEQILEKNPRQILDSVIK